MYNNIIYNKHHTSNAQNHNTNNLPNAQPISNTRSKAQTRTNTLINTSHLNHPLR